MNRAPAAARTDASQAGRARVRERITVEGRVQGVGFRPFVARLAARLGVEGFVRNSPVGVEIEAEADAETIERFASDLAQGTPASEGVRVRHTRIGCAGGCGFQVIESLRDGKGNARIPQDTAVCGECLREMRDPANRRHGHPFINCAHCGPRASIIISMPYDRERTAMDAFAMCARCRAEYESPGDRRFHAEALACPDCGPRLAWRTAAGGLACGWEALARAVAALRGGGVVALKGLSGFHLMAPANDERAVRQLRAIKDRDAKPFAIMYPTLDRLEEDAYLSEEERRSLASTTAPIVLVARRATARIAPSVAMHNPLIGAMLPAAPLHHLLIEMVGRPLVATSANSGNDPIIHDDAAALDRFGVMVDGVLGHDREIVRPADDSVVRFIGGAPIPLRVGRGIAPLCIEIPPQFARDGHPCVLALGGHEKSSIALARDGVVTLGRHLGDLATLAAREGFEQAVRDLLALHAARPDVIACDAHPDYFSTGLAGALAREFDCPVHPIQHHAAHMHSLLLEGGDSGPRSAALCFDGTGHGADGTVWGAEWLIREETADDGWRRIATMLPLALPGGETAIREPWRVALSLAFAAGIEPSAVGLQKDRSGFAPSTAIRKSVEGLIRASRFCAPASSMGRLFDGVASLIGLRHRADFSAQPAMELEFEAMAGVANGSYEVSFTDVEGLPALDWRPMIRSVVHDAVRGVPPAAIAASFHASLARACAELAVRLRLETALLTGGCFQNRIFAEAVTGRMKAVGISPRAHRIIPPNDGGLSAGQAMAALLSLQTRKKFRP